MDSNMLVGIFGSIGTVAFFAFCTVAVWMDFRKKKAETEATHAERMKAIEMGIPSLDAEIERARAYASAAWAAGLIGLLVPITVISLAVVGTIVAIHQRSEDISAPLIVAWSIAGFIVLITVVCSLRAIRHLPRPSTEAQPRPTPLEKHPTSPTDFHKKPLEL
jgi:hypothetical protein